MTCADGVTIAADLVVPDAPRRAALLAPAMGVPRRFYRPFVEHLAGAGVAVLSFDYRGMAGSARRGIDPSLDDWAELDLPAALARLRGAAPGVPVAWIGHSMGGQLLGLVRDPAPVDRALLVAAQHGHWRNWPRPARYAMAALWWGVIPALIRAAGRWPMAAVGQGDDVPARAARQWARWGRDREYVVGHARRRGGPSGFDGYRGALVGYALADDRYAPASTVRPLIEAFGAARGEVRVVRPADVGVARLGHFGAFRPAARRLWDEWVGWLTSA